VYVTGVGCPASGLLLMLVLLRPPESRAGGESGCGFVLTVIVAFPRLGGLSARLLLPGESAIRAATQCPPAGASPAPRAACVESGSAHTRVSGQPPRRELGGTGRWGGWALAPHGGPGQPGHRGRGDSPASSCRGDCPAQFAGVT
jgi:hypothetical protein